MAAWLNERDAWAYARVTTAVPRVQHCIEAAGTMRRLKSIGATVTAALVGGLLACTQASAQAPAPSVPLPPPTTQLSAASPPSGAAAEGTIGGGSATQRCVEVEIGGEAASGLDCLNQQLKREVERVNPAIPQTPVDARSPDIRVGLMNQAALRQQFGPNFGHAGGPFRPPHR
jgi:hypothetical protein